MDAFSLNDAKIKVTERSRGRMKIQIKLSKDEAEGFKNFCKLKPPELNDETFFKQIFFAGCNVMTEQIRDLVAKHEESKKEESTDEQQTQETPAEEQSQQDTPKIEQPNE